MFGGNEEGWGIRRSSRKKPATVSPTSKLKLDVHISLFSDVPPSREIGDECKSPEGAGSAKEFPSSNANETSFSQILHSTGTHHQTPTDW